MPVLSSHSCEAAAIKEISSLLRKRLEEQGYVDNNGISLRRIKYWLRLTPALCMTWVVTATILRSPVFLFAFVPFALMGVLARVNPFDMLYNYALRHFFKGPPLPPLPKPRRFACLLAAVLVLISAFSMEAGIYITAYIIGAISLVTGMIQVSTGYCIPSLVYRMIYGK